MYNQPSEMWAGLHWPALLGSSCKCCTCVKLTYLNTKCPKLTNNKIMATATTITVVTSATDLSGTAAACLPPS
jgi:hypothetical protein